MPRIQETEFQEHFDAAKFTDANATQSLAQFGEAVSLMGRRGTPDLFVFAIANRKDQRAGRLC